LHSATLTVELVSFVATTTCTGLEAPPHADARLTEISRVRKALDAQGAVLRVIADHGGTLGEGRNAQLIERTLLTTRSVEFDALLIAGVQAPYLISG
jgi:catalase